MLSRKSKLRQKNRTENESQSSNLTSVSGTTIVAAEESPSPTPTVNNSFAVPTDVVSTSMRNTSTTKGNTSKRNRSNAKDRRDTSQHTVGNMSEDLGADESDKNNRQNKRKKSKSRNQSRFHEIIYEQGFYLIDEEKYAENPLPGPYELDCEKYETELNEISCRPAVFAQKLESHLNQDGRAEREFKEALQTFLKNADIRVVISCCEQTTLKYSDPIRAAEKSNYSSQESLFLTLMKIESLQSILLQFIFDTIQDLFLWIESNKKKPNMGRSIESRKLIIGKFLQQLRLLDKIFSPDLFIDKVFTIIAYADLLEHKIELIQLLPAFLVTYDFTATNATRSNLNKNLIDLLKSAQVRAATINAIGHLTLPIETLEAFGAEVGDRLSTVSIDDLPCITQFVLGTSPSLEAAKASFRKIRSKLKSKFGSCVPLEMGSSSIRDNISSTPIPSSQSGTPSSRSAGPRSVKKRKIDRELNATADNVIAILNAIHKAARENASRKLVVESILATYEDIFKKEDPIPIDLILLFSLYSKTPHQEKVVQSFLVSHIKSNTINNVQLTQLFNGFSPVINRELNESLLNFASQMLTSSNISARTFGQEMYQALVVKSEGQFRILVLNRLVLHLESVNGNELDASLSVLFQVATVVPSVAVKDLGEMLLHEKMPLLDNLPIMRKLAYLRIAATIAHFDETHNMTYTGYIEKYLERPTGGKVIAIIAVIAYASSYAKLIESRLGENPDTAHLVTSMIEHSFLGQLTQRTDRSHAGTQRVPLVDVQELDPVTTSEDVIELMRKLVSQIEDDPSLFVLFCDLLSEQILTDQMPFGSIKKYVKKDILRKFDKQILIDTSKPTEEPRKSIYQIDSLGSETHAIDLNNRHNRSCLVAYFRLVWIAGSNVESSEYLRKYISMPISLSPSLENDLNINWVVFNLFRQFLNAFATDESLIVQLIARLEQLIDLEDREFNSSLAEKFSPLVNMNNAFDETSETLAYKKFTPNPFTAKTNSKNIPALFTQTQGTQAERDNALINLSWKENCGYMTELHWQTFELLLLAKDGRGNASHKLSTRTVAYLLRELNWKLVHFLKQQRGDSSRQLDKDAFISCVTNPLHVLMWTISKTPDLFPLVAGSLSAAIEVIIQTEEPIFLRMFISSLKPGQVLNATCESSCGSESAATTSKEFKSLAAKLFRRYGKLSKFVKTFSDALVHVGLLKSALSLYDKLPEPTGLGSDNVEDETGQELRSTLATKCESYLKADLGGLVKLPELRSMLDIYLDFSASPAKSIKPLIISAWEELIGGQDDSPNESIASKRSITKSDIEVYCEFKEKFTRKFTPQQLEDAFSFTIMNQDTIPVVMDVILKRIPCQMLRIPTSGPAHTMRRAMESWFELVNLYRVVASLTKAITTNKMLKISLKAAKPILEAIIKRSIPLMNNCFSDMQVDCVQLVKSVQHATRYMHRLCIESKKTKDSTMTGLAPPLKSKLEEFLLRIKGLVTSHGRKGMVQINNLKLRGLDNEELPLNVLRTVKDADIQDDSMEEIEEAEEDGDTSDAEISGQRKRLRSSSPARTQDDESGDEEMEIDVLQ